MRNKILAGIAVLILAAPLPAAAQSDEDRAARLHQPSPAEFAKQDDANRKIDFDHIDQALLDAAVFHETNRRRTKHELAALDYRPGLREAARLQARAMRRQEKVTHRHPDPDLKMMIDRLESIGIKGRYAAENVAKTFGIRYESGEPVFPRDEDGRRVFSEKPDGEPIPPHTYLSFAEQLLDEWMASPGHRKNILATEPEFLGAACLHDRGAMKMDVFYCAQVFFAPFP
jgi:uncharacterized protein YkwD